MHQNNLKTVSASLLALFQTTLQSSQINLEILLLSEKESQSIKN